MYPIVSHAGECVWWKDSDDVITVVRSKYVPRTQDINDLLLEGDYAAITLEMIDDRVCLERYAPVTSIMEVS